MPNKQPNPNKIRRQPTPDSPPPPDTGARQSPDDRYDWEEVAPEEAEEQRRHGDVVTATHGQHDAGAGERRQDPPRVDR
jgi:hypothetical protein